MKTLPLTNNEEIVGTIQLCFKLQIFNDTSFDNDIKSLKQFGLQNEVLNNLNDKERHYCEIFKHKKDVRSYSASSSSSCKTNKSKEELTSDYLMGKLLSFCFIIIFMIISNISFFKLYFLIFW